MRGSVTPFAREDAVRGRQQLQGVDAQLDEIRGIEACDEQPREVQVPDAGLERILLIISKLQSTGAGAGSRTPLR